MYRMNNRGPKIAGTLRDTALDGLHWRASLIELDKLLAARKVAFKPLQSHVTDTIVLQFGKQDLMVESVKLWQCQTRFDGRECQIM